MIKFRVITVFCCVMMAIACLAQRRQLQEARVILKSGKNFEQVEKMMTDLLKDTANQENTRIYDFWLQSVEKQYGAVNEQMYKKQKVDTVNFFTLTKRIFTIGERLDSFDKKGRVNLQYRKDNAERLNSYRPNLFFGGAYYLRKLQYQKAFDYFETYIDCIRQPLFSDLNLLANDERIGEAAYWASYCGYRMNDPVLTLRHANLTRLDSTKLDYTLQYVAESWKQLNDDSLYVATLWEGFRKFPKSGYFFPRLIDNYTAKGNYERALAVADEALEADSLSELYLFAKSTMLLNLGEYAKSLSYSKKIIEQDEQMADAYYNAGTACMNMALGMDPRNHKKQIKKMYQKALPYMETYRQLAPQAKDKWAPALYRIYFNLNMGKQFDEINRILKK